MRSSRARIFSLAVAIALVGAMGCSFLVDFVDKGAPYCDGAPCEDATTATPDDGVLPDAALDAREDHDAGDAGDAGHDGAVDADAGPDADPCGKLEAGAVCDYLDCKTCGFCAAGACTVRKACPEGYNWDKKSPLARCCGGLAVMTNTNANCGVCGIVCPTAGGPSEDCANVGGHFLRKGCKANPECWSKCCSSSPLPSHCAASDCNTGGCPAGICPAPAKCIPGTSGGPNFCDYP